MARARRFMPFISVHVYKATIYIAHVLIALHQYQQPVLRPSTSANCAAIPLAQICPVIPVVTAYEVIVPELPVSRRVYIECHHINAIFADAQRQPHPVIVSRADLAGGDLDCGIVVLE